MSEQPYDKIKTADGYISASPAPDPDELAKFYADTYFQEEKAATYANVYSEQEMAHKRLRADILVHAVLQSVGGTVPGDGRLLEMGSGEGFLLASAHGSGWTAQGVDFSDHAIGNLHPEMLAYFEAGDAFAVLDRMIEEDQKYRVCILQNILEHLIDPVALLEKLPRLLTDDGLVVATVPNDYSRLQEELSASGRIDREYWFAPPEHLHYFNADNIARFAERCGFDVIDSYGDFPIEFFLFHPGSNYVADPALGKDAHKARMTLDALFAEKGLDPYLDFCRSLNKCGMGRSVTVVMKARNR